MGQTTHGIMYGIAVGDDDKWCGEDGDSGILGAYKAYRQCDIDSASERLGVSPWKAELRFVPYAAWDDDEGGRYVGFWISRGASECGMNGAVQMSRAAVKAKWSREYKNARVRWRRFVRFCTARGIMTDRARLWLIETEVA